MSISNHLDFTLYSHPHAYDITCEDMAKIPSISPYCERHWELADGSGLNKCVHIILAVLNGIPVIGYVTGLIERIVAWAIHAFDEETPKQPQQTQPQPQSASINQEVSIDLGNPTKNTLEQRIEKVKGILSKTPLHFTINEHYAIHHEVTLLADELRDKGDDIQKRTFTAFLSGLKDMQGIYPNDLGIPLDFSRELRRMEGKITEVVINQLDMAAYDQALPELFDLDGECFTPSTHSAAYYKSIYGPSASQSVYVAQDRETHQMLGTLVLNKNNGSLRILSLSRKADAARLSIGEKLFAKVKEDYDFSKQKVVLEVRESNTVAQKLYQKIGFKITGRLKNYYSCFPQEDALLMTYS